MNTNELPSLPEPDQKANDGVCCGNYTTGGEYLGQRETLCCGQPDERWPDYYTANQMRAYARQALADRERQAGEVVAWICFSKAPHWFAPVLHVGKLPPEPLTVAEALERGFVPVAPLPAPQAVQAVKTPEAFQVLAAALAADPGYAWSWHCAVWASAHDEGMETGAANRAAARFMHMAFGIDTSKNANFNAEHLAAAPSPDGKAEHTEDALAMVASKAEQAEAPKLNPIDARAALITKRIRAGDPDPYREGDDPTATQPTASNAGERE